MSIFERYFFLKHFKNLMKKTVHKPGTTAIILRGDLRGYKYIVNDNSGWAPIYGGWEPFSEKVYRRFIKKGDVVYDVGANTGITSLLFSKLVGNAGKVVAFEPVPANAEEIENVITLNGIKNITLIMKALSDRSGMTLFHLGKSNKSGSLVRIGKESGETMDVEEASLDDLIMEGIPHPSFIKIDAEGIAGRILEGFSRSIQIYLPLLYIELHTPEEDLEVAKFLMKEGYRIYRVKDPTAVRVNHQKQMLSYIKNMESSWPDPCGVWGTILSLHETRRIHSYGKL